MCQIVAGSLGGLNMENNACAASTRARGIPSVQREAPCKPSSPSHGQSSFSRPLLMRKTELVSLYLEDTIYRLAIGNPDPRIHAW